jgi:molecular chaperone HscB
MDPFATLGIARTFEINLSSVEKTHRELSRMLHPDRHATGGASERRYALSKAVEVNEAWRIVRDPIRRAEALFTLAGLEIGETHEPKPSADLLMDMMEQREALAEARETDDLGAAHRLASQVEARARRAEEKLAIGFREYAGSREKLATLVPRLGELRFYRRFLEEASEIEEQALSKAAPYG